jgi:glutaminyl-tRNA synthetase
MNPQSLEVLSGCQAEPSLASAAIAARFQFERLGYFCVDPDARPGRLVFNRTVTLRDSWARISGRPTNP